MRKIVIICMLFLKFSINLMIESEKLTGQNGILLLDYFLQAQRGNYTLAQKIIN